MTGIQTDILGIFTAHLGHQLITCFRRHQVIVFSIYIEHRHGQFLEIHLPPSDNHFVLQEFVALVAILDKGAEYFTR